MFRTAAAMMLTLTVSSLPARAADSEVAHPAAADESSAVIGANFDSATLASSVSRLDVSLHEASGRASTRPGVLPALYAGFSALQAFDVYSTRRALAQGAQEANPMMKGIVGNPVAFMTMKAATTVLPMLIAERMWRTNRVGAIVTMVVANSAMATVAANNARVLRQQR